MPSATDSDRSLVREIRDHATNVAVVAGPDLITTEFRLTDDEAAQRVADMRQDITDAAHLTGFEAGQREAVEGIIEIIRGVDLEYHEHDYEAVAIRKIKRRIRARYPDAQA